MKALYQRNSNIIINNKKKNFVKKISLCTTCMDRLHHLEKTLPHNLKAAEGMNVELIVVNYNSGDNLDEWIAPYLDKVIYRKTTRPYFFNQSHAKNCAHRLATGEVVINIDADNYVSKEYLAYIFNIFNEEGVDNILVRSTGKDGDVCDVKGRIAISKNNFAKLGGYDEDFFQRGLQDEDLRRRATLLLGLKEVVTFIGSDYIEHNHGERISNCPLGEIIYVEHVNSSKCKKNIDNKNINPNGNNWGDLEKSFEKDANRISHKNARKVDLKVTTGEITKTADVGVVFLYHKADEVTTRNFEVLKKNNPNIPIIPLNNGIMSFGDENDVFTKDCGDYARVWSSISLEPSLEWRNSDMCYMAWYSSHKRTVKCNHWVLIEYDTYVNMDIRDFIKPNLGNDVTVTAIKTKDNSPDWPWWRDAGRLPAQCQGKNLIGVTPISGVILTDKAFDHMSKFYLKNMRHDAFAELRFGSIAKALMLKIEENKHPLAKNVRYEPHSEGNLATEYGICHPVKFI